MKAQITRLLMVTKNNTIIHKKLTPKTDYVKLARALSMGDIIPYAQTLSGKDVKQKFASLNIEVEYCPLPKDVKAFGAVKVIKMDH